MKLSEAKMVLLAMLEAGIPVYLSGPPGCGKSAIVREVALEAGRTRFYDCRASQYESIDFRGLPSVRDGITTWNPPDFLPWGDYDGSDICVFFDELSDASMPTQTVLYQYFLDNCIGTARAPRDMWKVAAGNRQKDRAGAGRTSTALNNRFGHIEVEPDVDDTCDHFERIGLAPAIVALLRLRRELLYVAPKPDEKAFPTPRGWERVARVIHAPESIRLKTIAGIVGDGAALETESFLQLWKALPRLADIVAAPHSAIVPADTSTLYALASGLASMATPQNAGAIFTYAARLPAAYEAMLVSSAVRRNPAVKNTAAFVAYAVRTGGVTA